MFINYMSDECTLLPIGISMDYLDMLGKVTCIRKLYTCTSPSHGLLLVLIQLCGATIFLVTHVA